MGPVLLGPALFLYAPHRLVEADRQVGLFGCTLIFQADLKVGLYKRMTVGLRVAVLAALLLTSTCGGDRGESPPATASTTATAATAVEWFTDRAAESGLDFVHFNGMSGEFYYPEMFAPGVGLIDVDNDGDLDVYVVQGQMLGKKALADATIAPRDSLRDRLFRNDLVVAAD